MLSVLLLGGSTEPVLKLLNIRMGGKKTTRRIDGVSEQPFSYRLKSASDDAGQWQIVEDEDEKKDETTKRSTPRRRDSNESTDRELVEESGVLGRVSSVGFRLYFLDASYYYYYS